MVLEPLILAANASGASGRLTESELNEKRQLLAKLQAQILEAEEASKTTNAAGEEEEAREEGETSDSDEEENLCFKVKPDGKSGIQADNSVESPPSVLPPPGNPLAPAPIVLPPPPPLPRLLITVPAVSVKATAREAQKRVTFSVNPNSTVPSKVPAGSTPPRRQQTALERLLNKRRYSSPFPKGLPRENSELPRSPTEKRPRYVREHKQWTRPAGTSENAIADIKKVLEQPLQAPYAQEVATGELELRGQFERLWKTAPSGAAEQINSRAADKRALALTAVTHLISEQFYLLDSTLGHLSVAHLYQFEVNCQLKELRLQLSDLRARTRNLCDATAKARHCELTARADITALLRAITQLWEAKSVATEALRRLEAEKTARIAA